MPTVLLTVYTMGCLSDDFEGSFASIRYISSLLKPKQKTKSTAGENSKEEVLDNLTQIIKNIFVVFSLLIRK